MAHEIGGTFTRSQFERFRIYVQDQVQLIDARIAHLKAERDRIGSLAFAYDSGGNPAHVTADLPTTYIGKLFGAYEALGGNVEFDLQVRGTHQPVFRLRGDVSKPSQLLSNGEAIPVQGLSDAESATIMQQIRSLVQSDMARRRDYLERKIRRAIDYAEQLTFEISQLELAKGDPKAEGSLEYQIKLIDTLTADRNYMAITNDDSVPDPHGKFAKAPVAPYMPGEKGATATGYQRTLDGLVKPAQ